MDILPMTTRFPTPSSGHGRTSLGQRSRAFAALFLQDSRRRVVEQRKGLKYVCFVRLYDVPVDKHFVEDEMCFFEVVHDVQLAHVPEVPVHGFHQAVDELEDCQFVLHRTTTSHATTGAFGQLPPRWLVFALFFPSREVACSSSLFPSPPLGPRPP
eukprot:scaffold631_cov318-Pavlova_lutheri.AAC.8